MTHIPYPYEQVQPTRYKFFSIGKSKIEKIVDFVPTKAKNVMNLGFGDLLADGSIEDRVASNNGDIVKVLATIVMIVKHFTELHPHISIFFIGSTEDRTKLYARILKMYHAEFSKEFIIYGNVKPGKDVKWLAVDQHAQTDYFAFLIKRIN